jgi:hypothetical protein
LVVQNNLQLLISYKHNTRKIFLEKFCRCDIDVLSKIIYLGNLFVDFSINVDILIPCREHSLVVMLQSFLAMSSVEW